MEVRNATQRLAIARSIKTKKGRGRPGTWCWPWDTVRVLQDDKHVTGGRWTWSCSRRCSRPSWFSDATLSPWPCGGVPMLYSRRMRVPAEAWVRRNRTQHHAGYPARGIFLE